MILGALVDAGVSLKKLQKNLSGLHIKGYKLNVRDVKRAGIRAAKVDVVQKAEGSPPRFTERGHGRQKAEGRRWKDIEKIIKTSSLSKDIKQKGLIIFKRLFEAEAEVHGVKFDKIHLHELGAIDCIVDIFGTLIGLDVLGIKKIYSSPLNLGSGTIKTEHGILSVPAPATAELLKNIPVYSSDINFELTTPTGAVLISLLADDFGPMPKMKISKIGTGAGSKDFKNQPNVLRIFVGEKAEGRRLKVEDSRQNTERRTQYAVRKVTIIETNIDDMNPQIYGYVMERLFEAGALDVFLMQVIMKKSRPGIKLTVLCNNDKKEDLMRIILKETTSIGLRFYEAGRRTLDRQIREVNTKFGKIKVKVSSLGDDIIKYTPEYEDCRKIAKKFNVPLLDVIKSAVKNNKLSR